MSTNSRPAGKAGLPSSDGDIDASSTRLTPQARKVLLAGSVGSVLEWYDFGLYSAASALVIGPVFFPSSGSSSFSTLAAFATFAVGFGARPLGGMLIAHFGDRVGRKPALMFTLSLMGASTVLMGCLPSYHAVGIVAPLLLIALRLLQGAGAGAELAGAFTMISETAPLRRRAFATAVPNGATAIGGAIGSLTFLVISQLPKDDVYSWAWRLPFLFSAVIFLIAFFIRNRVEESPEFLDVEQRVKKNASTKLPITELLRLHRWPALLGLAAMVGHQAMTYVTTTFALSYVSGTLKMGASVALTGSVCASIAGALLAGAFGILADRIGPGRVFIGGALYTAAMAYPFFALLDLRSPVIVVLALIATYSVSFGAMAGAQGAYLASLFPTKVRYSGVAFGRELSSVIVGGPAPFIASALVTLMHGTPWLVSAFLLICGLLSFGALLARPKITVSAN